MLWRTTKPSPRVVVRESTSDQSTSAAQLPRRRQARDALVSIKASLTESLGGCSLLLTWTRFSRRRHSAWLRNLGCVFTQRTQEPRCCVISLDVWSELPQDLHFLLRSFALKRASINLESEWMTQNPRPGFQKLLRYMKNLKPHMRITRDPMITMATIIIRDSRVSGSSDHEHVSSPLGLNRMNPLGLWAPQLALAKRASALIAGSEGLARGPATTGRHIRMELLEWKRFGAT